MQCIYKCFIWSQLAILYSFRQEIILTDLDLHIFEITAVLQSKCTRVHNYN